MISKLFEVAVVEVDHLFIVVFNRRSICELVLRSLSAASTASAQARVLMNKLILSVIVLKLCFLRLLVEGGFA
jgi:hypothetical protein